MGLFNFFFFYNYFKLRNFSLNSILTYNFFKKCKVLNSYFIYSEMIWQEGLLIDFLQKKIIDNWIKKFLIISSYLFNERLIFDKVIRFYLNLIILPMHKLFNFEFKNTFNVLFIIIFIYFLFIFYLFFIYFLFIFMF